MLVNFSLLQNVLAAVFSAMFGAKDPDQVNTMAKQAGEVRLPKFYLYKCKYFLLKRID